MDQSTLIKIARLRTLAARQGKAFDVVRFAGERAFAKQVLANVMDTDDENVLVLGLQLMQALGLMETAGPLAPSAASGAAAPAQKVAAPRSPKPDQQYVGRLR